MTGTQREISFDSSFSRNQNARLWLTDLIKESLYDFNVEGIEREVISIADLFTCLEKYGITFENEHEKEVVERILRLTSIDPNWLLVSNLTTILKTFGIKEDIPDDSKFLKFSNLKGKDIRIINRIIYYKSIYIKFYFKLIKAFIK